MKSLDCFETIWVVDFEFHAPIGETPTPICMVAREVRTGRLLQVWEDDLRAMDRAPFRTDEKSLFVAYYASAELGCFIKLGWKLPARILDLYAEFRCVTSGLPTSCGHSLAGALTHYGLDSITATEKESMRNLAIRGGPFTTAEQRTLPAYCQTDVDALVNLLPQMAPRIDLAHALMRGRYMCAAARMEYVGIPIDLAEWSRMKDRWEDIKQTLITRIDQEFGVFEGQTFKADRFAAYLNRNDIAWPQHDTGNLDLSDDTFGAMAEVHPQLEPLRQLRQSLARLRLTELAVGPSGRNRCLLSAFRAKSSRNAPSNTKFVFGPSKWIRGLIKPIEGRAIAHIDWSQQEFGIAAALSGDQAMMEAYRSADPYLAFAQQAGAAPADATKETHGDVREQFKVCCLGVQYGMGAKSLAVQLRSCEAVARKLLSLHRQTYATFWDWNEAAVSFAMLHGYLHTVFGWRIHVGRDANPRSLGNFPMQANGAEMLRLACCLVTERAIQVNAPIHDAILIEGGSGRIDEDVADAQAAMAEASRVVLDGFELRSDAEIVRYPDRFMDPRGRLMWDTIQEMLGRAPP